MSRVRSPKAFRRVMRQMPDAARAELVDVLQQARPAAEALIRARVAGSTRSRTGRLVAGVKSKVYPRSLRLRVGFLGTKSARAKLFYARILDLGRKAQTVSARQRKGKAYQLRLGGIAPKRFVTGGESSLRAIVTPKLNGFFDRALRRIGGGE